VTYDEQYLLGWNIMHSGRNSLTFRSKVLLPLGTKSSKQIRKQEVGFFFLEMHLLKRKMQRTLRQYFYEEADKDAVSNISVRFCPVKLLFTLILCMQEIAAVVRFNIL
jgi:hypothetical protein